MIEVVKIEDFVIEQLFLPYMPNLKEMCHEYGTKYRGHVSEQKIVERNLRRNPELIIHFLNENLETKERVFSRLKKFGGVKWYRYLDMRNPVIRWVNENLEGMEDENT